MTNLFSRFEPQTSSVFSLNWFALLLPLALLQLFWSTPSQISSALQLLKSYVKIEAAAITGYGAIPGFFVISVSLFLIILSINVLGLCPYVFTPSRHIVITLSLALPLWVGHMTWSSINAPRSVLRHFVPRGTPAVLMPFIVLIELVRNVIRPLTLAVRLAANIIAGHLLITLIGSACTNIVSFRFVALGLTLLIILESAVALIQAYVFSTLSTLYLQDSNSPRL